MTRAASFLVDLDGATAPADVLAHVRELSGRLGPRAAIDVRWPGELPGAVPEGVRLLPRGAGARALAAAAARATASDAHLVVLLGPVLPERSAVDALAAAFELDPLVGFAQPRFAGASGDVWSLPCPAGEGGRGFPAEALGSVPDHYFTTERLAACLAVRGDVAAWFTTSPDEDESLPAALLGELCQARRRGYRNLVLNRVIVATQGAPDALYPILDPAARRRVMERFPDALRAAEWFGEASHRRFEHAVAAGRSAGAGALRVLLDCRGAQRHHNGTSRAILGLLDGLDAALPRWDVDLLFGEEGARFHEVARRYPRMRLLTGMPDETYAAAVRLDQPWALSTVAELHRRSAAVAFNILDSIAWDVVYAAPPEVGRTWRFISEHADGLLYNSGFTQARFGFRFPVAPGVAQAVTHHSLDPAEYADPSVAGMPEDEHILVFGNRLAHKAVAETTELLARAFPYRPIRAFGGRAEQARHNVSVLESGHVSGEELDRLVATSRVVVFPSHYEGFGLPVVSALAYGRTVAVRASPLWREIAARTRMPGRLVQFAAPHDLVEVVGRALRGEPLDALPLGDELGDDGPPRWRDCAGRLAGLVERIATRPDARRWCARDQALELVRA